MNSKFTLLTSICLVVCLGWQTAAHAQKFVNPLPIPYLMPGPNFNIDITSATHNFDPNGFVDSVDLNVPIPTYCYNEVGNTGMTYLGPTLIFEKGKNMTFDIANKLDTVVNTTVHWHGLNIPAEEDGGPHQVINHNATWSPSFPVIDPVQTVWYHSHLMNQTTDQVIRGMAGMIQVQDPTNDPLYTQLPHTYGQNDFPINIQEKGFIIDRNLSPPKATALKAGEKPGNGPFTIVNGVVGAVLRVPPEMVRLRILNGSPRKMFHIGLSTTLNNPTDFADMYMIATGGGYLDYPRPTKSTLMAIGDRREFVVDFSQWPHGDTVYMSNLGVPQDANYGSTPGSAIMAFVVDDSIFPNDPISSIPATLKPYSLAPGPVFKTRNKKLYGNPTGNGQGSVWTIDSIPMNLNVINDTVLVNTKERWVIDNTTNHAHPFHIHKVQFQVTKYEGTLGFPDGNGGITDQTGVWEWPDLPDELFGYKDVQLIRKNSIMTFEARFDSFPSPFDMQNLNTQGFMYHCHILTHEDTSMMHQFVVVDSLVPPPPASNVCAGAFDINPLFGGPLNEPQVSSLYDNTLYTSVNDPDDADDCYADSDGLQHTIWYSFTSPDGATYGIQTIQCTATNYIDFGDTQMTIYAGDDCGNLTQVACNEDEDVANGVYNANIELPTDAGTTYFILIDGYNGLEGEFCLEVTNLAPNSTTSAEEAKIELFPNPTTGKIQLKNVVVDQVQVFDGMGRLVFSEKQPGNIVDLSEMSAGVYFLKIMEGGKVYSARVVKE